MTEYSKTIEKIIALSLPRSPDSMRAIIPEAARYYCAAEGGAISNYTPSKVIAIASAIASYRASENTPKETSVFAQLTPGQMISAQEIIKKIHPRVFGLRRELFGKEEAPFTWDQAIDWIENEANKDAEKDRANSKTIAEDEKKLQIELRGLCQRFNDLSSVSCSLIFNVLYMNYPCRNGHRSHARIFKQTRLAKLEDFARKLAEETNFNQTSLVMYCLAGAEPFLILFEVGKSYSSGRNWAISIKFNNKINYQECMRLYRDISSFFKTGRKQLDSKHQRIYELINNAGGIPRRNKLIFWKNCWEAWNYEYPNDKFKSPDGLRIGYTRIMKYF